MEPGGAQLQIGFRFSFQNLSNKWGLLMSGTSVRYTLESEALRTKMWSKSAKKCSCMLDGDITQKLERELPV